MEENPLAVAQMVGLGSCLLVEWKKAVGPGLPKEGLKLECSGLGPHKKGWQLGLGPRKMGKAGCCHGLGPQMERGKWELLLRLNSPLLLGLSSLLC